MAIHLGFAPFGHNKSFAGVTTVVVQIDMERVTLYKPYLGMIEAQACQSRQSCYNGQRDVIALVVAPDD